MSEEHYRLAAAAWLARHCPATLTASTFDHVTQGRYWQQERARGTQRANGTKIGYPYSSCGDLAHALLWDLGVRSWWVNRAGAGRAWRVGQNVSLLCAMPLGRNPIARVITPGAEFPTLEPGDIIVVNAHEFNAHVSVVLQGLPLTTCDYGQPHGSVITSPLWKKGTTIMRGSRALSSVLNLGDVLVAAEAAGELLDLGLFNA